MKLGTFLFINFMVSFISDIILRDIASVSEPTTIIGSLQPYFRERTVIGAGIYAGITIVIATLFVSIITLHTFLFSVPYTYKTLGLYMIIAYVAGYIIDVIIDKTNLFGPTLRPFYKKAKSGHWGAIAFVFSILVSYIIQKTIVPLL